MPVEAKQTILVVEDEALVRMYSTDILESAGFRVLEAETADEAIEILQTHDEVHLLFSDVDMPGSMDGLQLAALVNTRWPGIRLLITSGHHTVAEGEVPHGGHFVRKPWNEDHLVESIRTVFAHGE